MFTGAWRICRKLVRRVEARVSSVEARNFRFRRSADEEADRAAREPRRRSRSQESRRRVRDFPVASAARGGA